MPTMCAATLMNLLTPYILLAGVVYFVISAVAMFGVKKAATKVKSMSDKLMIDIQNVSKWYGEFQVLTDCSLPFKKAMWWWYVVLQVGAANYRLNV